jgi:hypothetical protein
MFPFRLFIVMVCVGALFTVLALSLQGQEEEKKPRKRIIGVDIAKFIKERRATAREEIKDDIRKDLVQPLIKLAQTKGVNDFSTPKEIAIHLLGELRYWEVVGMLVEEIDYCPPNSGSFISTIFIFPCASALIKIGKPATEAILKKCEKEIKDKNLILYAWVISHVEGDELGKYRIELELKKTTDPQKKKNLEQLLKVYKTKKQFFSLDKSPPAGKPRDQKKEQRRENNSEDVRKEQPEPGQSEPQQKTEIVKPRAKEEAPQAQERTDWPVPVLSIAVVVLAGIVVFLLLRRPGG